MSQSFKDRAKSAFLGLALGDAYGRPLEFVHGPDVRTDHVHIAPGHFQWTDDTHMAIYLAKAILDLEPRAISADKFGHSVAKRFVEWSHDPLTPSTAPGGTCLQGARNYEETGQWDKSGVFGSDGCGAVMRICPLPLAFRGPALIEAAAISANVTHRHPNAAAAAIAASQILREILETGILDAGVIEKAIRVLAIHADRRECVTDALRAALEMSKSRELWLDERAIPEGSGGWRSASALGLAIAASLRWDGSFEKVVDRAARIDGDSDSVACLAGMFAGAAHGLEALPKRWLEVLPQREEIESLAERLVDRPTVKTMLTA